MQLTSRLARSLAVGGALASSFTPSISPGQGVTPVTARGTTPVLPITNAETVSTDTLNRPLPTHAQVGDPKADRWVGLFYWQWHGGERWWKHYNMTAFLKDKPYFRNFEVRPENGPAHPTWYWAEPLFGYYRSTDEWVMRKHVVMLADAGVDFLFLDYTNSSVYDAELRSLIKVLRELRAGGVAVPRLTFFFNHQPEWKIHQMYVNWYAKPEYDDVWFTYRGKPLLMGEPIADASKLKPGQDAGLVAAINDRFTFRKTWALFKQTQHPTRWRFIAEHNPPAALDPEGEPEQVVVCKSMGGPLNNGMENGGVSGTPGRKFKKEDFSPQWTRPDMARGLWFDAAWKNAEAKDVPITLVTGWNEWKASVWDHPGVPMFGIPITKPYGYLVDQFNEQFNRDLEPMRGGYGDVYYQQFVARMRAYKGMAKPQPTSPAKTIDMTSASTAPSADAWADVTPKFFDAPNDTAERDADATVPELGALAKVKDDKERQALPMIRYTDDSARNDLGVSQVARDADRVYLRATTTKPLTPADGAGVWLFVDTDANARTGWNGYELVVNRTRAGGKASVEKLAGKTFAPTPMPTSVDAPLRVGATDVVIALPRSLFETGALKFDFKWADHLPATPTVDDFYTTGDAAPNGRFNFRFDEGRK